MLEKDLQFRADEPASSTTASDCVQVTTAVHEKSELRRVVIEAVMTIMDAENKARSLEESE